MGRVIINGDDFGMNKRCTLAIAQAFGEGLITDTTIMANGELFDYALSLARQQGFSDRIGIHFNLTEGTPLTQEIMSVAAFVSGGCFHKAYTKAPRPLTDTEQSAVYAELTAQVHRLLDAGIAITHADSHHYIHNIPHLAPIVARVCCENGIGKVRLQRDLGSAVGFEENNSLWRGQGFVTTAHFGRLSDVISGDIPDDTEIMVHPDLDIDGRLIDRRGMDGDCPTGDILRRLSDTDGVTLFTYRDL